jgi:glutathione peroxidase
MKTLLITFLIIISISFLWSKEMDNPKSIYDFTMQDIDGKTVNLKDFSGKVVLLVNVASKCGFTYQYEGLEKLYKNYKDQGFVILGFPANNFLGQEPGTNIDIKTFCSLNYGVTFPMFAKISVKGKDKAPLYVYLTDKTTNPKFGGEISWNFNKFLINKKGEIVNRFDSKVKPEDDKIISEIEKELKS